MVKNSWKKLAHLHSRLLPPAGSQALPGSGAAIKRGITAKFLPVPNSITACPFLPAHVSRHHTLFARHLAQGLWLRVGAVKSQTMAKISFLGGRSNFFISCWKSWETCTTEWGVCVSSQRVMIVLSGCGGIIFGVGEGISWNEHSTGGDVPLANLAGSALRRAQGTQVFYTAWLLTASPFCLEHPVLPLTVRDQ